MKNASHFGNFVHGYEANSNLIKTIHSYSNYNFTSKTGTGIHTVTNTYETNRDVLLTKHNQRASDNATISSVNYSVNSIGQRTSRTTTDAANATSTAQWGYNATGEKPRRLVGVLDRREAPCLEEVSSREAAANQLTKADHSDTAQNRAYNYDGIGNRLTSSAGVSPASSTTYTPNALNQYAAVSGGAFQAPSPAYDDDGNATAYPLPENPTANATLIYDGENRLINVVTGSTTVVYRYDAQSRRIAKSVGAASNTFFIYDYWNCIGEYTGANQFKSYTWGMDLSGSMQGAGGVGGLLAVHDGSASYYPTYDGNGNISEYLDANGIAQAHYEYDAFGNTVVSTGTKANDFAHRFSTKPLDAETGLYYYGYRYYAPDTGRWLSRDPAEESGGLNLYSFVNNDPLDYGDYLGLKPKRKIMIGFFGAGQRADHLSSWPLALTGRKGVKTFNARSWDEAKQWLLEHPQLDENNDGEVDKKDSCVDLRIVGFSWGGWSALRLSQWLKTTKAIKSDNLRVVTKLGMLDTVDSWRTGTAQVPDNVKYSKEIYQTTGCINGKFTVNGEKYRGGCFKFLGIASNYKGVAVAGVTDTKDVTGEGARIFAEVSVTGKKAKNQFPDHLDLGYRAWGPAGYDDPNHYGEQIAKLLD